MKSTALLGGVGGVTGLVDVEAGGVLSPGSLASEFASFKVGSLTLANGSTTRMTVSGTNAGVDYDQVAGVGGAPSLVYGGTLALTLTGSYADYTTFHLFSNFTSGYIGDFSSVTLNATGEYGSLSGVFTKLADSWVSAWTSGNQRLQFNAVTGDLIVVPEPGAIVLAGVGVGLGGLLVQRRRRRRRAASDRAAAEAACSAAERAARRVGSSAAG